MKKIFLIILSFSMMLSSCKKTLDKEFSNPEVYSKTGNLFAGMFTKTLYSWKLYVQDYGEWWWEIAGNAGLGIVGESQIAQRYITDRYSWFSSYGDLVSDDGFEGSRTICDQRLAAFYGNTNTWAVIKDNIASVSGTDLTDNQIYYSLVTVMKDYAALVAVDFYNDIPYSEAFQGKNRVFLPKYDNPKDIYISVLNDLKKISTDLPGQYNQMSASAKAVFTTQDIAFAGDVNKWVQYVNAIRLKYAVRLSGADETLAKTYIQEVLLQNNFPTADQVWKMPYPVMGQGGTGGDWLRGITEGWSSTFIPDIIMRRMNKGTTKYEPGIDDPRLPAIAMPTKYSDLSAGVPDYRGVNMNADGQKAGYLAGQTYYTGGVYGDINAHLAQDSRSMYNIASFYRNENFPVYMMSLAETDLLLAEVALKGLGTTGKTADQHIKDAISHSTNFWYARNSESPYGKGTIVQFAKPAATDIATYANTVATNFNSAATIDDKMEILMQQKYIHLNLMCPYELWAELRRTRHPKLEPLTFNGKIMKPFAERLRYPSSEQQTNPDNYEKVRSQDNFTTSIFWVSPAVKSLNPYWDDYNY